MEQVQCSDCQYTVCPIRNREHITKLQAYLQDGSVPHKTSFCRFYLRGLCIMRSEYCKFAHDFSELVIGGEQECAGEDASIVGADLRKKFLNQKVDFHQRPLFFIKNLDYHWLYQYQFTPRFQQSQLEVKSLAELGRDREARHRVRMLMHREQWDKFASFIQHRYRVGDYHITLFSNWFAWVGFEKSQTGCRFNDFIRYLVIERGYFEVNVVMPPRTLRTLFLLHNPDTLLYRNRETLFACQSQYREQQRVVKESKLKRLPAALAKKFICRYYMSGNCEKDNQGCTYAHDILELRYQLGQVFEQEYRQPAKTKDDRQNYISLHRYYMLKTAREEGDLQLEDLKTRTELKSALRKRLHVELYRKFLGILRQVTGKDILQLKFVEQEYHNCGFNHTDENKFGQFEAAVGDMGYHIEEIGDQFRQNRKFIFEIPPMGDLDAFYRARIQSILKEEIARLTCSRQSLEQSESRTQDSPQPQTTVEEEERKSGVNKEKTAGLILESTLRRLVYATQKCFQFPMHAYLRLKGQTLRKAVEELLPEYCSYVFFEDSSENYKKLVEFLKEYFKRSKKQLHRIDDIEGEIRLLSREEFNRNYFINFKLLLHLTILQCGKEIYYWPFSNNFVVMNAPKRELPLLSSELLSLQKKSFQLQTDKQPLSNQKHLFDSPQRATIVVVDSLETVVKARWMLDGCVQLGVDLQGNLRFDGSIDLVQISSLSQDKSKDIFIFDILRMRKQLAEAYFQSRKLIKELFEDTSRVKILHDCRQDSIALKGCLNVHLRNVFDTSGMDIYLQQRRLYAARGKETNEHLLKMVCNVRVPGLNHVLEKWQAPHGPNQFKLLMKKRFQEGDRRYFELRPINQDFLAYSARDVQDLIEVYRVMQAQDAHGVAQFVGQLYANANGLV